jgi:phage terminase small subunit
VTLSLKQERFVDEYMIDLNATAAAERAEYKHPNKQGPRLLVNVGVQEAIAERRAELSAVTKLTREHVAKGLQTEATWHGDDSSASARVSAWRELGKLYGFYPPERHEITFPDADIDAALDAEVERLIASGQTPRPLAPEDQGRSADHDAGTRNGAGSVAGGPAPLF